MFKPDFSKPAMQKFFLHHTEKIILAVCILLLGLFFWMGFQAKPFDTKTPEQLSQLATQAGQHIQKDTSWEDIKEFRKGNDKVKETIVSAEASVKPDDFVFAPMIGTVAATLDPRMDPIVEPVKEPIAEVFTAPVLITMNRQFTDPFSDFPPAGDPTAAAAGGARGGLGNPGGLGGGDDEDDEEPEDDEEGDGPALGGNRGGGIGGAGGLGGLGGAGLGGGSSTAKADDDMPEVDAGGQMQQVHADTFPAMRPVAHGISADSTRAILRDVVVVTGLVDYKTMWNSYDKSFSSGIGYYPDRDKPIFQYLQVERKEIGKDGKEGEWVDWSENVSYNIPGRYPEMHRMPKSMYSTAPDIVAPENYDPLLTGPIPAAVMVDYRPYIMHPKLVDSTREFPELKKEEEAEEFDPNKLFAQDDSGDDDLFGGAPSSPAGRGGGIGGVAGGPGGLGTPGLGGGPGAGSMGGRGRAGGTGGSGTTPGEEVKQTRSGTDFTDYWKALQAKKPTSDYKLVRFFDIQVTPGAKYKYRMRVWVGDPNNEDPAGTFAMMQGGSAPAGLGGVGGLGSRGGIGGAGMGPGADQGEEEESDEEEEGETSGAASLTKMTITSKMKHPDVRKRLNRATEEVDPNDSKKKKYFVSEPRSVDENGEPVYEKVAVPEKRPYLRFARPSTWSPEVEVEVQTTKSQVAAGKVQTPKMVRFNIGGNTVELPGSEPAAEVAASVWDSDLGTAVTSKRTAYRGDALDFYAPSHVLHPITWRVYVAKNDSRTAEGPAQYLLPIETGTVVVDALGGEELPLPRTEKMRHNMASEVLVMDNTGAFHVQNDIDDRTTYRNLLFLPDEAQTVGGEKARRKAKKDEDDEPDGLGGGRGGLSGAGGLGGLGGLGDDDR